MSVVLSHSHRNQQKLEKERLEIDKLIKIFGVGEHLQGLTILMRRSR